MYNIYLSAYLSEPCLCRFYSLIVETDNEQVNKCEITSCDGFNRGGEQGAMREKNGQDFKLCGQRRPLSGGAI